MTIEPCSAAIFKMTRTFKNAIEKNTAVIKMINTDHHHWKLSTEMRLLLTIQLLYRARLGLPSQQMTVRLPSGYYFKKK